MKGTRQELVDKTRLRKKHYQAAFAAPGTPGYDAYVDLAKFCRAFEEPEVLKADGALDTEAMLINVGRRQAFYRIFKHLHLEPDELVTLYARTVQPGDE